MTVASIRNTAMHPMAERVPSSPTPGQTIGPFFHRALRWASSGGIADRSSPGTIVVEGTVEDGAGDRLPAWMVEVFGVGLTRHFFTAVFLEPAVGVPSMLDAVPAERRSTLVAARAADGRYRWIIRTQGERETVFLDYR
jgi:protocatechuate 3,4-dioxygenase alpha subunit